MTDYQNTRVCIFDFDGTLVDTMNSFADLAASIIEREYNIPFNEARKQYLDTSGLPFFKQLDILFPNKEQNTELANEFELRKKNNFFTVDFPEDVKITVKALRENNIKIAISSNNFQNMIESFVNKQNLTFDYILGYKNGFSKGRDHFKFIEKNSNCLLANMVFVGDSLNDARIAINCGVKFIAKIGTFSNSDFNNEFPQFKRVNKLYDLISLLIP